MRNAGLGSKPKNSLKHGHSAGISRTSSAVCSSGRLSGLNTTTRSSSSLTSPSIAAATLSIASRDCRSAICRHCENRNFMSSCT